MREIQANQIVRQLVKGLDYPASKGAILAAARKTTVGPTVQDALDKIADREYRDAEDLTKELNAGS
jgi:uncharacterized protein DUF2795